MSWSQRSGAVNLAVRTAVALAHGPVVRTPSAATATPQPATIHHTVSPFRRIPPIWLAISLPPPAGTVPAANTEPITATPRVAPTWRLVEATAAATPAWLSGMPDTAVFVIGALTNPKPIAKTT